jgi:hypothetical protein
VARGPRREEQLDHAAGHHLFAGLNRGAIHRGSYDPSALGGIRWETKPEREASSGYRSDGKVYDFSRVLCFAECNGDLYMASRITLDATNQPVDGGLYRRVDGAKPTWKLVSRWTVDPAILLETLRTPTRLRCLWGMEAGAVAGLAAGRDRPGRR